LPFPSSGNVGIPLTRQQLEKITAREPPEVLEKGLLALRVGVESGGCHGYQYTMEIVEERGVDD
jgi:Fe-S cluster assembly iron-binding protein IscA